jgi:hypothetical protein
VGQSWHSKSRALQFFLWKRKLNQLGKGYDNILGRSVHTITKYAGSLIVVSKEIGLEVNEDKSKYTAISRDQNAGRSHSIRIKNSPLKGWKSKYVWEYP